MGVHLPLRSQGRKNDCYNPTLWQGDGLRDGKWPPSRDTLFWTAAKSTVWEKLIGLRKFTNRQKRKEVRHLPSPASSKRRLVTMLTTDIFFNFSLDTLSKTDPLKRNIMNTPDHFRPLRASVKPVLSQGGDTWGFSWSRLCYPLPQRCPHGCTLRSCVGTFSSSFLCGWAVNITFL